MRSAPGLICLGVLMCTPVLCQSNQAGGLSHNVEWRLRYEARNDATFDSARDADPSERLSRLRLGLTWKDPQGWTIFLQPQYSYQNPHRPIGARPPEHDLDMHQGWIETGKGRWQWRIGRQQFVYGESRLIGNGGWTNVGRSFDAVRLRVTDARTSTDLWIGKIGQQWPKTAEPVLATVYSTIRRSKALAYDLYFIHKSDTASGRGVEIHTLGTRPTWSQGGWSAMFEGAFQFGHTGGKTHEAWAYAARSAYTFPGTSALRIGLEQAAASGGSPNDPRRSRTFDQLYPTGHMHHGLLDYQGWRNMESYRLSLSAKPARDITVTVDGWLFRLRNARDFWYAASGRPVVGALGAGLKDDTGAAGREVGREVDVLVNLQATKSAAIQAGYGRFFPGRFVRATNGAADPSDWFYVQTTFTF